MRTNGAVTEPSPMAKVREERRDRAPRDSEEQVANDE
jgi:small subunit ribosomal protein S6